MNQQTIDEFEAHKQFIANELLTLCVVTEDMSLEEKKIAAEGNAEHILLWVTSKPMRPTLLGRLVSRLFGGKAV